MPASIISLLNEDERTQLFSKRSPLHCDVGYPLFERGEPAENMYLVERGKVSLFRLMPNGDEKLFRIFTAGEMIEEMEMFI